MQTVSTLNQSEVQAITKQELRAAFMRWYVEYQASPDFFKQAKFETKSEFVINQADFVWDLLDTANE